MTAYVYLRVFESEPRSSRDTGGAAKVVDGPAMRDASSCNVVSWEIVSFVLRSEIQHWAYVDDMDTITLHANGRRKVTLIANRGICKDMIRISLKML
jgi:hypothetical protein